MPSICPHSLSRQVFARRSRRHPPKRAGEAGVLPLAGRAHAQNAIRVGADHAIRAIAAALAAAIHGKPVEVQVGDYRGAVMAGTRNDVTVGAITVHL